MTNGRPPGQDERAKAEFKEFFLRHQPRVLRTIRSHWRHSDSEAIVSQAFEKAWENWYEIEDKRIEWVMRVAKNLAIDAYRRQQREGPLEPAVLEALMTQVGIPADRDDIQQLLEILPRLAPRLETVLVMRAYGFTVKEIAQDMECQTSTVSRYLSEARDLVAEHLDDPYLRPGKRTREGHARRAKDSHDSAAARRRPRNHHDDEED